MAEISVFEDCEEAAARAAALFIEAAHQSLCRQGYFAAALSGGSTPIRLFQMLASDPVWRALPWDRTHIFWADERAVPPGNELSNFGLAREHLLESVPLPEANVHRMRGELGAAEGAAAYVQELIECFGPDNVPVLDFLLMGVGTDGHTASLFPGSPALDSAAWVEGVDAPTAMEPQVARITLTLPVIRAARRAVFLACGASKRNILQDVLGPDGPCSKLPAALASGENTVWLLDKDSAKGLAPA